MQYNSITKEDWDKTLEQLLLSFTIFGCVRNEYGLDYDLINPDNISDISYNQPKPATPLKSFFLPVKENVTSAKVFEKPRIILGIPNCDIEGLRLLDEIYLDSEYCDNFYKNRRENTLLIATDCFGIQEHCHCSSYNIKPYSDNYADLAVIKLDETVLIRILSSKGKDFIRNIASVKTIEEPHIIEAVDKEHQATQALLLKSNEGLADYRKSGEMIAKSDTGIWEKYSSTCVSCGACTTICPTCSCFLLIEKPGLEKVKQMDACQYPGFERVAGGEDALFELHQRFRNRYMCKYCWKPMKFNSGACTGCGRCIEACIGKINKNEILLELAK
jgi:sulfhydrogenase subunit beta (sulfur reductase)